MYSTTTKMQSLIFNMLIPFMYNAILLVRTPAVSESFKPTKFKPTKSVSILNNCLLKKNTFQKRK